MTAENAESNNASGGDDLRARYLPVSRKELRRRREAELASERGEETPEEGSTPEPESAQTPTPPWGFAALINEKTREVREDERAESDASDLGGDPDEDAEIKVEDDHGEVDRDEDHVGEDPDTADGDDVDETAQPVAERDLDAEEFFGAEEPGLPEDRAETDSDAPEEDVEDPASDEHASELIVETELIVDPEPITAADQSDPVEDAGSPETSEPEASSPEGFIAPDDSAAALSLPEPPRNNAPAESEPARPQDLPSTEIEDDEDAPVPASRKSRRSLRLTGSMSVLSEEKLAELNELQQELSAADDPNRVDPELLKKQQAFAARAMQANQERLREEQAEAERDQRMRRRRLRPESEVITRKALRAHMESDEAADQLDYATGSIEPIQARGAHGLEIDAMVEHSTRQGARQSMMGWLVIILAVLLVIAIGVVLSFIL